MEWQQLEYFRMVAKTEHFRKAAELLAVSQPALSRAISNLEDELGITLFDRIGRSVKLNKFGRIFLQRVENGMKEILDGVQEIEQLKNPYTGTISIAFLPTLGITILPEIIRNFNKKYPQVEIHLYQGYILESIQRLMDREVDLCLITNVSDNPNVIWYPLFDEELFLYVPSEHRLAQKKSVSLKELENDNFIAFKKELAMREVINSFFRKVGTIPKVKFEGEDVANMAGLVSAGLGVTIIPAFHGVSNEKIKQIAISEPKCHREIGLVSLKNSSLSPSVQLFKSYVSEMFQSV